MFSFYNHMHFFSSLLQPILKSLANSNLFFISKIVSFQNYYTNGIIQCIILLDWISSLRISLEIHLSCCIYQWHYFLLLNSILWYVYTPHLFKTFSCWRTFGVVSSIFRIMDKATLTCGYRFCVNKIFIYLGWMSKSAFSGSYSNCMVSVIRKR